MSSQTIGHPKISESLSNTVGLLHQAGIVSSVKTTKKQVKAIHAKYRKRTEVLKALQKILGEMKTEAGKKALVLLEAELSQRKKEEKALVQAQAAVVDTYKRYRTFEQEVLAEMSTISEGLPLRTGGGTLPIYGRNWSTKMNGVKGLTEEESVKKTRAHERHMIKYGGKGGGN